MAGRDLGFFPAELAGLAANGVRASFLDPAAKEALLAEIAAVPLPYRPAGVPPRSPCAVGPL